MAIDVPPISFSSKTALFVVSPGGIIESTIESRQMKNPSRPTTQTPARPQGMRTASAFAVRSARYASLIAAQKSQDSVFSLFGFENMLFRF